MSYISIIKIIILNLLLSVVVQAGEFAIAPLVINIEGEKNTKIPFEFTIKAKKSGSVQLKVFDLNQIETGHMGFVEADKSNKESKANWVSIKDTEYSIKEGEFSVATGYVVIPSKAKGQHLAAVMVEEMENKEMKNGITVNVRYAVILKIDTLKGKVSKVRTKTQFDNLTYRKVEGGWEFEGVFENQSKTEGKLFAELQLRNNDKKLVGKLTLKTLSAWQRNESESMVYPGSKVKVFGKIPEDLSEGVYDVRIKNKFNDRNQPVIRENITLKIVDVPSPNQAAVEG